MRIATLIVALTVAALTGVAARWAASPTRRPSRATRSSSKSVGRADREADRARRRLGATGVSIPGRCDGQRTLAIFPQAGLVIRGGAPPVSVSVPKAWRSRVAIGWARTAAARFGSILPSVAAPNVAQTIVLLTLRRWVSPEMTRLEERCAVPLKLSPAATEPGARATGGRPRRSRTCSTLDTQSWAVAKAAP